MPRSTPTAILAAVLATGLCLAPQASQAHWCDDLWASSYNIVVKPDTDILDVPGSGSATMQVWVRNNMGYPLVSFALSAQASGFGIAVAASTAKVDGYLLPGENLKHLLTVTGGGQLNVETITFYVSFGEPGQDGPYGPGGSAVMVKKADGTVYPGSSGPYFGNAGSQAVHLGSSVVADYGDLGAGMSQLLGEFCAGRGSWESGNGNPIQNYCEDDTSTQCPPYVDRWASKFDWQHLWSAGELARRVSVLSGGQLTALRERFVCAWNDGNFAFQSLTALTLGYLGDDGGPARAHLEGITSSGAAPEQDVAKAALLLFGDGGYLTDVQACLGSGNAHAESICAAALGIAEFDDDAVNDELVPRALWVYPDNDNGLGFFAAHVLDLVAWDRRGWTTDADDSGLVSFYGEIGVEDTVPPAAPAGMACDVLGSATDPVLRVSWDAVSTDAQGGAESVTGYDVYWGQEARAGSCTQPKTACDPYVHSQGTTSVWLEPPALDAGSTYYFAVSATDGALNEGAFSTEVSCVAPTPINPPAAAISCDPTTGTAPLTVSCDCDASSDPDGDLTSCHFSLDGGAEETATAVEYQFDSAGSHAVTLRVVDGAGLEDTDAATVTVTAKPNEAPVAQAAADPASGVMPLEVSFSAAGSADPDGTIASYHWDFGDDAEATDQAPTHTFTAAGVYDVVLTVTDDGSPPLQGIAVLPVTVDAPPTNDPPDLTSASATPTNVAPGQAVHFDAAGVFDPDGDAVTVVWDFGDTGTSTQLTVDHAYAAIGDYQVTLTAQDDGVPAVAPVTRIFDISVAEVVEVDTTPPAAPTAVVCSTLGEITAPVLRLSWDPVSLDVAGDPESVTSYDVYWGKAARDGACTEPGTGCDPYTEIQATSGVWLEPAALDAGDTYYFAVAATDAAPNQSAFSAETACVAPAPAHPPTAVLSCDPTFGAAPLAVSCDCHVSSDPDDDITSCHFRLDAGAEEIGAAVGYQFDTAGSHSVSLRVVDGTGLEDTATQTIAVNTGTNTPPSADATADPTSGVAPLEVSFSAAGSSDPDGAVAAYHWAFGDTAESTDAAPTHVFAAAGVYNVTLTVLDDGAPPLEGVDVVTVTVTDAPADNHPPDVSFASATPTSVAPDEPVRFDASGVLDPDGDGFTVAWDFGDGESSSEPTVDHPYAAVGSYQATLTAQDDGAPAIAPATQTYDITVTDGGVGPPDNQAPVVSASATPDAGTPPLTVVLDASATTDPDGDGLTFEWVFADAVLLEGDDVRLEGVTVEHVFTEPGTYTVTLNVTDDAEPPLRVTQKLEVLVYDDADPNVPGEGTGEGPIRGGCRGSGVPSAPLFALFALALLVALGASRRRARR